jgi:hypothetical protein
MEILNKRKYYLTIYISWVPVVHQAAKESAADAKQQANFIKAYNNDTYFYRGALFISMLGLQPRYPPGKARKEHLLDFTL